MTAQSDPDLFWALRGGGGDHAIVTAMEIGLVDAPRIYGGRLDVAAGVQSVLNGEFQSSTSASRWSPA